MLQMPDAADDVRRILQQIGNQNDQAAPLNLFGERVQRLVNIAATGWFDFFQRKQQRTQTAERADGRKSFSHLVVEQRQAGGVGLVDEHEHEAGSERAGIVHFGKPARVAERHALGRVEQNIGADIRLLLIAADDVAVGARIDSPVNAVRRIAARVFAVVGELHGRTMMRRAVQSLQRALDRPPHGHAQPAQPVGEFGREKFIGGGHVANDEFRMTNSKRNGAVAFAIRHSSFVIRHFNIAAPSPPPEFFSRFDPS